MPDSPRPSTSAGLSGHRRWTRDQWIEDAAERAALSREHLEDATCRDGFISTGFYFEGVIRVGKRIVFHCGHSTHILASDARDCARQASGLHTYRGRVLGLFQPGIGAGVEVPE